MPNTLLALLLSQVSVADAFGAWFQVIPTSKHESMQDSRNIMTRHTTCLAVSDRKSECIVAVRCMCSDNKTDLISGSGQIKWKSSLRLGVHGRVSGRTLCQIFDQSEP
jgi:hypothetical protein